MAEQIILTEIPVGKIELEVLAVYGSGADVIVQNSEATVLAEVPPGDTYQVEDTPYTVKNQFDETLDAGALVSAKLGQEINVIVAGAQAVLKNTAATILSTTNINSGQSQDIQAPDATAVVKDDAGNILKSPTIPSGVSEDVVINDSIAVLKNTAATILSITNINAEASQDIQAPDATAVVKDDAGNILKSPTIPSGVSEDVVINDSVAVLKNTAATILSTTNINAEASQDIQAPDATAVVKDDAGNILKSPAIPSGVSEDVVINDSVVNVNGNAFSTVNAEGTINVEVVDESDNPVGSIVAGKIQVLSGAYDVGTIDRHGNVLPTIIVSSNQTFNWKSRDFRDSFLSNLTDPTAGKEATIEALCDDLVAAGLMGKARLLNPFIGGNAVDNSLNLAYPFVGYAGTDRLTFVNSPTHGDGFLQGTGTQHAFAPISSRELINTNLSLGFYSLTNAINATAMIEMGFGGTAGNGIILAMMSSGSLGSLPFFGLSAYGLKMQVNPANAGGLIMGHQSSSVRKITQGTTILGTSGSIHAISHTVSYGLGILAGGDGSAICARKLGAAWVGEFLSVAELSDLNTIMQDLMTNKGVSIS